MDNIHYKTEQLVNYFSSRRRTWNEFYPSEQWVFKRIFSEMGNFGDILDVGCACGGLGNALAEYFPAANSYLGVDIHEGMIDWAKENSKLTSPAQYIVGDITKVNLSGSYDTVFSLSCADWNIETSQIIGACWDRVKPGGYFVMSLRVTNEGSINDIGKSYQYINFCNDKEPIEFANYVVFNFKDILNMIKNFKPSVQSIGAYGYWGKPSPTAVTPFRELVFAVFYIKKATDTYDGNIETEFALPLDIFL